MRVLVLAAGRGDVAFVGSAVAACADPFAEALPELLGSERLRLARRIVPADGHVFFPLLVGTWTRKPP